MFTKQSLVGLIALLMLWSCEDVGNPIPIDETPPPEHELIWVGKVFSGGRQCTDDIYTPPDTKRLLNKAGIAVFATAIEHYAVCRACIICPTYSAMHMALIRESQLTEAEVLGFRKVRFGARYGVIGIPTLTSDSLLVRVGYGGCNRGHSFRLQYHVVADRTVEMWLHKTTPDQACEAYFEEDKAYRLPNAIRNYPNVVLLCPSGRRFVLRSIIGG